MITILHHVQNNLLDGDKQEALDLLTTGEVRRPDWRDRAGLVLPRHLHHGRIYSLR